MTRLTNHEARQYVLDKKPFKTNNETMFGLFRKGSTENTYPPTYTVYSYGEHFPMYVYDYEACQWIGNKDKYSRTTTNHQRIVRPNTIAQWVDTDTLKRIAVYGLVGVVAHRMS